MAKGIIIKTTGEVEPFSVTDDYRSISEAVGGLIDSVSDHESNLVGYVHDEGLLIGLAPNVVASSLFGRPLVGDCVVFGLTDANGIYDGENHDIPEEFLTDDFSRLAGVLNGHPTVRAIVEDEVQRVVDDPTPRVVALTDDQFDRWLNGEGV